MTTQEQYHELLFYTLAHKGKNFIHQHVVDAHAAQTADANTEPITLFFALAGLYLAVEKNYTGKQVQNAHLHMAKKSKHFTAILLPESRGSTTAKDVLNTPPGADRDGMIREWCVSVWTAFSSQHQKIIASTESALAT